MPALDIPTLLLIVTSPAVGSFIAVLVDRLARGEDVVRAPSRCRSCAHRLGPAELVPLVSYILQRGRCRHCGAAIPAFTLYCEILATGAAVLAVLAGGGFGTALLSALWLWLLIALAMSDAVWMRLPDVLTGSAAVLALLLAVQPAGIGLAAALWGAVLGAGSFAVLRGGYFMLRGRMGLGLGDVKLMAGLGAFCGPFALPQLVLVAALGALAGAVLTRDAAPGGLSGTRALPFGTALCGAAALMWLWRAAV